jgi:plastocyanin
MIKHRKITILLSSILLGAAILTLTGAPIIPRVAAANRTITLVGFITAWNNTSVPNPTITVNQGDVITLQLSSGDAIFHQWFVDVDKNGPAADCPGPDICSSAFSTSTTLTFTVSFAPGTYTYYCILHPASMLGQFIVNPSTTVGGSALPTNKLSLIAPYIALASALAVLTTVVALFRRARDGRESPRETPG